jgi:uncharacterized RDD family membrane protein YckC
MTNSTTSQTSPNSASANGAAPSHASLQGQYAGFVTRLFAISIDFGLVFVTVIFLGVATSLILSFFGIADWLAAFYQRTSSDTGLAGSILRLMTAIGSFSFVFFMYYTVVLSASAGMTVGHAIMGVRVVRMDGRPITWLRAIRRYLMMWVAAIPLFAGFFWIILDDRRQGWHDKLANTCVIYDWPAREDEGMLKGLRSRLAYMKEARHRGSPRSDAEPLPVPGTEPATSPETAT